MAGEVGGADLLKNAMGAVIGLKVNGLNVPFGPGVVNVSASRAFTELDNGQILECTAPGITLSMPAGLSVNWNCQVIPNGTTSVAIVAASGCLLNGAGTTLTRAAGSNAIFTVVPRVSAKNSYVVTGS